MHLEKMSNSEKAWTYMCVADFSEPPLIQTVTIAIRVKNKESQFRSQAATSNLAPRDAALLRVLDT